MPRLGASPAWTLLHSWSWTANRFLFRDVFVNVAVSIPLGLCANLTLRRYRLFGPLLLGIAFLIAQSPVLSCCSPSLRHVVPARVASRSLRHRS